MLLAHIQNASYRPVYNKTSYCSVNAGRQTAANEQFFFYLGCSYNYILEKEGN